MTKNNITIRPFNITGILLLLVCFVSFSITLVFIITGFYNGFYIRHIIGITIGTVISVLFGVHFGRYVFFQKIELYDDGFIITYIKNFKGSFTASIFKLAPIETKKILYSEIDKYGFFLQNNLRKGGRNDENKKVLLFSSGKIPVPFVVPDDIEETQAFMIFNCKNGEPITIDASLYRYKQIQDFFYYLKKMSGVSGKCSENPLKLISQMPIVRISIVILLVIPGVLLAFGLRYLDSLWNTAHPMTYENMYIRIYTISSFLAYVFTIGVVVTILDKSGKGEGIKSFVIFASIASWILTVACFIISLTG